MPRPAHPALPGSRLRTAAVLAVILAPWVGAGGPGAQLLGDDVLPNGGFEQWGGDGTPTGWEAHTDKGTAACDAGVRLAGEKALRLQTPDAPARVWLRTPAIPCQPDQQYHARVAYRTEGMARGDAYEGVAAVATVEWQSAEGNTVATDIIVDEYYSRDWCYRDRLLAAPATAAQCCVYVQLNAWEKATWPSTVWFDDVGLRPYDPATVPTTFTSEWSVTQGKNALRVPGATAWFYYSQAYEPRASAPRESDPDASLGSALHSLPGAAGDSVFHSAYTTQQPPGLCRAFFRLKGPAQAPPDRTTPIASLEVASSLSLRGQRTLDYDDFHQPGQYEDLAVDFVKPSGGWLTFRVTSSGKGVEFWVDHVRVVLIQQLSDPDLLEWYPGFTGLLGPETNVHPGPQPQALVVEGILSDAYRLEEAFAGLLGWRVQRAPCVLDWFGNPSLEEYPPTYADLRSLNLVLLGGVSITPLGPEGRLQLLTFVRNGGGLVVLGGKGFNTQAVAGSFLEQALPVTFPDTLWNLQREPGALRTTNSEVIGEVQWSPELACPFIASATVKEGASVAVKAGDSPLIVTGTYGKGRVVCILGTAFEAPWADRKSFVDWDKWPGVLAALLSWAAAKGGQP